MVKVFHISHFLFRIFLVFRQSVAKGKEVYRSRSDEMILKLEMKWYICLYMQEVHDCRMQSGTNHFWDIFESTNIHNHHVFISI